VTAESMRAGGPVKDTGPEWAGPLARPHGPRGAVGLGPGTPSPHERRASWTRTVSGGHMCSGTRQALSQSGEPVLVLAAEGLTALAHPSHLLGQPCANSCSSLGRCPVGQPCLKRQRTLSCSSMGPSLGTWAQHQPVGWVLGQQQLQPGFLLPRGPSLPSRPLLLCLLSLPRLPQC
jgi:hypothetical protein